MSGITGKMMGHPSSLEAKTVAPVFEVGVGLVLQKETDDLARGGGLGLGFRLFGFRV